jgi:hypothetical protein
MGLLSYSYYSTLHNKVTQADFDKAEAIAEHEISRVIGPIRFQHLTAMSAEELAAEFYYSTLMECIADLIDYDATVGKKTGGGVASVSNDGYSESYNAELQKMSSSFDEKAANIRRWLSGTGLVRAY